MTPIQTNKPVFFNSSGEPLNGTIYIGQPDADPRTSPKTVTFRDSGGSTFTASQPLTTINGRITYNGKPIVALVDGEYSMLVFDSAGAQVDYARSVNADGTSGGGIGDFSEVTRVGLTLSEVKAFDVAVGETVENIGKSLATDGLGEEWLVISATGSPGDDVDLIDFDNGLQGRRITNDDAYVSAEVILGGDFGASTIYLQKTGDFVSVSSAGLNLTTGSAASLVASDTGVIPSGFRPNTTVELSSIDFNGGDDALGGVYFYFISDAGTLTARQRNLSDGAVYAATSWGEIGGLYKV